MPCMGVCVWLSGDIETAADFGVDAGTLDELDGGLAFEFLDVQTLLGDGHLVLGLGHAAAGRCAGYFH